MPRFFVLLALASLAGCGAARDSEKAPRDRQPRTAAPFALPLIGLEDPANLQFPFEKGAANYHRAVAAYKGQPRNWAQIVLECTAALERDPHHLDAQRLLAAALAQTGKPAEAAERLVGVLAADWLSYRNYARDEDLKPLWATPHGAAVHDVAARIAAAFQTRAHAGLWVLGRRSAPRVPKRLGTVSYVPRAELYAYDREAKRYLRLTRTGHQVIWAYAATSASAVLGTLSTIVHRPAPAAIGVGSTRLDWVDTTTWKRTAHIALPTAERFLLRFGAAHQISIVAYQGDGLQPPTAMEAQLAAWPQQRLTPGREISPPLASITWDFVEATTTQTWPAPAIMPHHLAAWLRGRNALQRPNAAALSLDGTRLATITPGDACAGRPASLYVVDLTAAQAPIHVFSGQARFTPRWVSATELAYEDESDGIRIWNAVTQRQTDHLTTSFGVSLGPITERLQPGCAATQPAITISEDDIELLPEPDADDE